MIQLALSIQKPNYCFNIMIKIYFKFKINKNDYLNLIVAFEILNWSSKFQKVIKSKV